MKQNLKLYLLFIPIAFGSYLFHEFGHWIVGELTGNEMVYQLNHVFPESGSYIEINDYLFSSIGGPAFTILLSLIFLIIIEVYNSIYAYPVVFFQFFLRFFSIFFGGFNKQDEATIASLAGIWKYSIAAIVLLLLFSILLRSRYKLKIDLRNNLNFIVASTISILIVIGLDKIIYSSH